MNIKKIFQDITLACCTIPVCLTPVEWAEQNINFKYCHGARFDKFDISLTPYLKDILNSWDFKGYKKEVTVSMPDQMAKSLSWQIGLLYTWKYAPGLSLVVYPDEDKSISQNQDKLEPLIQAIPEFNKELKNPKSKRSDKYVFKGLGVTSRFLGSQATINSFTSQIRISDETDKLFKHSKNNKKASNKLEEIRKRARIFDEAIFFKCGTIEGDEKDSRLWQEWEKSSRGRWYLRCLNCDKLTFMSTATCNLKFDRDNLTEDSIKLVCPICKHRHIEADKFEMNRQGAFKHKFRELINTDVGFLVGGLGNLISPDLSWIKIAEAQLKAGASGSVENVKNFYNSIRGVPIEWKVNTQAERDVVKSHCIDIDESLIKHRFLSADVQGNSLWWIVRGIDNHFNSYLLGWGNCKDFDELQDIYNTKFAGAYCTMCVQDLGGARTQESYRWIANNKGAIGYKGDNSIKSRWQKQKDSERLFIVKPKFFQEDLLYKIYSTNKSDFANWYLPQDIDKKYVDQILDKKPNPKDDSSKYNFSTWISKGNEHLFDCEKMFLYLLEYFRSII